MVYFYSIWCIINFQNVYTATGHRMVCDIKHLSASRSSWDVRPSDRQLALVIVFVFIPLFMTQFMYSECNFVVFVIICGKA